MVLGCAFGYMLTINYTFEEKVNSNWVLKLPKLYSFTKKKRLTVVYFLFQENTTLIRLFNCISYLF